MSKLNVLSKIEEVNEDDNESTGGAKIRDSSKNSSVTRGTLGLENPEHRFISPYSND